MSETEVHATFWEHLDGLRGVLIRCFLIIGLGFLLSFFFYEKIFYLFTLPFDKSRTEISKSNGLQRYSLHRERIFNSSSASLVYYLPERASVARSNEVQELEKNVFLIPAGHFLDIDLPQNSNLVLLSPLEGIITSLKISLWIGIAGTSPFWLFFLIRFIAPALHLRERHLLIPFVLLSFIFFALGLFFAFFLTIPLANIYLYAFNNELGSNLWSFSSYMNYTLTLLLANGVAFECSLLLFFLVHMKILSAEFLVSKRRHFIVFAFILAALLTPPDVLTQFLLAIPLMGFYELAILYARLRSKTCSEDRKHKTELKY